MDINSKQNLCMMVVPSQPNKQNMALRRLNPKQNLCMMVVPSQPHKQQNMALRLRYTPSPKTETHTTLYCFHLSGISSIPFNFIIQIGVGSSLDLPKPYKKCIINDLPKDMLEVIFGCLRRNNVGDLIRVSAVCKSWRILVDSMRQQQITGPFLFLDPPRMKQEIYYYHLFDFSKHKTLLPNDSPYQFIYNFWNEWIVTSDRSPGNYNRIHSFTNLLSRARVELPPILNACKIIVSSAPSPDPNCIFLASCWQHDMKLAFCKLGEKEWKIIRSESGQNYRDILYFKGEFYAVTNGGNLVVCDIDGPEPMVLNVAQSIPLTRFAHLYLVESSGNLFLIKRTPPPVTPRWNDDPKNTFEVYKLSLSKQKWQKVDCLGDNSALVVGPYASMSISAKDFPVKRDCIYYLGVKDIAVFNLKTELFEPTLLFSRRWPYWHVLSGDQQRTGCRLM